jgi:uncharacterized membrane protein YhaH (DUF805 family)
MANTFRISVPSLLSFKGRLRRSHYWVTSFALGIVKAVLTVILAAVSGQIETKDGGFASGVVELLFLWPTLALLVKRGHDRNRPARFSLGVLAVAIAVILGGAALTVSGHRALMVACIVIGVGGCGYLLVDYGFIDGTQGPNRYGPSPKGIGAESQDTAAVFD